MVGHSVHPEEPLMSAGLDSRGGMELGRALGETLGLDLPVTLLYNYKSISAIVNHINSLVESHAAASVEATACWDDAEEVGGGGSDGRGVAKVVDAAADKPSKLLKTLRFDHWACKAYCSPVHCAEFGDSCQVMHSLHTSC